MRNCSSDDGTGAKLGAEGLDELEEVGRVVGAVGVASARGVGVFPIQVNA